MKIKSNQPAFKWNEGFPLGNGHMGAMVLSGTKSSRIELTENTFYSGEKSSSNNQEGASKAFYEMREQAEKGNYDIVHEIAQKLIGIRKNYGTNLPVGSLIVEHDIAPGAVSGYERSLDIMDGIAEGTFSSGQDMVREEVFISHPEQILVYHIALSGNHETRISFAPGNSFGKTEYGDCFMQFTCFAYETMHCDELCGVMLAGYGQVVTDGICEYTPEGIVIQNASEIQFNLSMKTDFKRQFVTRESGLLTLFEEGKSQVQTSLTKEFINLRTEHAADIRKFMERTSISLTAKDPVTEKIPLLFQYGRYLLLSSSRSDSKLPAHLQGIWNDNVACQIGWTCDMHLDINTQMNYWPAEVTSLAESGIPLYNWIIQDLSPAGEVTARKTYGLDGWVGELVSNAWGYAAPYWASAIAPCPTGGIWILMQLWEHYQYSEDKEFLLNTAFPLIRSAAVFFNQYVFKDKITGYFTCGPSISPENSFVHQGKKLQISNGCTYEILIIRELFSVFLASCNILKLEENSLAEEVSHKLANLIPYRITAEGTLAEWSHDLRAADPQHRHTSHLLGLYPFAQLTPEETPDLCDAAEKTLERKLTPAENWEDTGWARSMLLLYETRLGHGSKAYEHIKNMTDNLLEPNNLVYHPPTRGAYAFDHVYELDGNTGLTTAIAEMLLQSHKGILRLLPALPKNWDEGSATGLLARGNIRVDLYWENGGLRYAKLISKSDKKVRISYKERKQDIYLQKEVPYYFN